MGEGAAETQTHSERGEETYRVKERVNETDTKTENRERKRERDIESPKELNASGGGGNRDRKTEGSSGLPCSDWPRPTSITAHN